MELNAVVGWKIVAETNVETLDVQQFYIPTSCRLAVSARTAKTIWPEFGQKSEC